MILLSTKQPSFIFVWEDENIGYIFRACTCRVFEDLLMLIQML